MGLEHVELSAVVVDDGSLDGTAPAIRDEFQWAEVLVNADAPLFWCRGMNRAMAWAQKATFDAYLLLNDDTVLQPDAVARLLECAAALRAERGRAVLVTGSTCDARTGALTYGGERRRSLWRPVNMVPVVPSAIPQPIDTFNGNIVLLPAEAVALIGNLDAAYEHAMGDTDYGLRAGSAGVEVWLAPGFHGTCSNNPLSGSYRDAALPPRERWRHMLSRKGLPWRSWVHFTRRHAGPFWPMYFAWPYLRLMAGIAKQSLFGRQEAR